MADRNVLDADLHDRLVALLTDQRMASLGYRWAFSSLTASAGDRADYDRRRAAGDTHTRAQRNLYNRFLGMLHHCLATGHPYQEAVAFPPPGVANPPVAA